MAYECTRLDRIIRKSYFLFKFSRPKLLRTSDLRKRHGLSNDFANGCRYVASSSSYYDVMEITPKASSSQVKAAYYRLSKKYHPDVNKDGNAQLKFSQLSEAYEVLGNPRSRTLYDQGLLNPRDNRSQHPASSTTDVDEEYREFFRKRDQFRRRTAPPTGKTRMFDFDEFYRQHYGESIKKQQEDKRDHSKFEKEEVERVVHRRRIIIVYCTLMIMASLFVVIKSQ